MKAPRIAFTATVVLAGWTAMRADAQPAAGMLTTVMQMVASEAYPVRAWGAYIAARHRITNAVPATRTLLNPRPEDAPTDTAFGPGRCLPVEAVSELP